MGAALYFCSVFDGREKKSTEMFCNFFLCAARFLFCFVLMGGRVPYVAGGQTGLSPTPKPLLATKFAFNCSQFWNQSMKNLHKCNVYKKWLILRSICSIVLLHGCVHVLLHKIIKDKMYLCPLLMLAVSLVFHHIKSNKSVVGSLLYYIS